MSQRVTYQTPQLTNPAWAGDYMDRYSLIPGGAKLDAATFPLTSGKAYVPSGTLIGRTYAERDAGTGFSPATVATDDELYLVAFDVTDALIEDDVELYRHRCIVKENFLPGAPLGALVLDKIRELYTCTLGEE
jgi:hypothetical protein